MSENTFLEVRHLKKTFEKNVVLKDISFSMKKGEVVVVVGPSGCGKSTFLRCINGLEAIDEGEILLGGKPVGKTAKEMKDLRQKVGMVFQSYELFPHMNIIDNVSIAPIKVYGKEKKQVIGEAEKLLDRVGLLDKCKAYPRQLSGGQKQRVAIVRALMMHPQILLLDEITAALDPEMVREVLTVILELAKEDMTMIIVTHEMAFAKAVADRVLFFDGGNIIEESEPKDFFGHPKTERAKKFLNTFEYEEKE